MIYGKAINEQYQYDTGQRRKKISDMGINSKKELRPTWSRVQQTNYEKPRNMANMDGITPKISLFAREVGRLLVRGFGVQ